ncbi:MAG TPA: alpha/beta hydrolase [Candidatus Binataceae bacterium]|nr:alpha/beta hydrolase [Candidatus Binataceae bacterium]
MAYSESFIDLRGIKIQLLKGGSGAPLLYLHGAGGEVAWLPFFEHLSRRFTVYVPAHPGFARSEGMERIDDIHDLVFHYVELMEALGLEAPHVVGLSLGGWLAAELAVHQTRRLSRLVLIDAVGLRVEEAAPIPDIFTVMPPGLRRLLFFEPESETARAMIPDQASGEQLEFALRAREATARLAWNPYLYDRRLRERLHRVAVPTLIIWGDSDRLVPREHAEAYRRGIQGSRLVTIEKCGHAPPFEKPDETARLVTDFLGK